VAEANSDSKTLSPWAPERLERSHANARWLIEAKLRGGKEAFRQEWAKIFPGDETSPSLPQDAPENPDSSSAKSRQHRVENPHDGRGPA
jgi:hypothetical protein